MGTELTPKFYEVLQKHIENGIPLDHMSFSPVQKRRARVCLDVIKQLEENEMMNQKRYLRQRWNRTETEIVQDLKVINWLVAEINGETKELSRYRVKKQAERVIRIGQSTGDWKAIEAGAKLLHKVEGLDKPETAIDVEANTHMLSPVFVDTPKNGVKYDEAQLDKLRKKYHAEKDKIQEMVEAKLGLFVESGSVISDAEEPMVRLVGFRADYAMKPESDIQAPEPVNIFDEDDPDDDGM